MHRIPPAFVTASTVPCLCLTLALGGILLKERAELWLQTAGAAATLALIWTLAR